MSEMNAFGFAVDLSSSSKLFNRLMWINSKTADHAIGDFVRGRHILQHIHEGIIEKKGRKAHAVEILCEAVSDDYLHDLRAKGVSYLFAGQDSLDLQL